MKRLLPVGPLILSCLLLAVSCSEPAPPQPYSYLGPGSVWALDFASNGVFDLDYSATVGGSSTAHVVGSYSRTGLGFTYLSIVDLLNTGVTPMYAVEAEGKILILRLSQSSTEFVPMLSSPACPSSAVNGNWVALDAPSSASATSATQAWYGTYSHDVASSASHLATSYPLTATTDLGSVDWTGTACSNGTATSGTDEFFFSDNGDILIHQNAATPTTDSVLVTMPTDRIASATELSGSYAAIVLNKAMSTSGVYRTYGLKLTVTATGTAAATATGNSLTDVKTGVVGDATVAITFSQFNSPSDGFIRGTVTIGTGTGNLVCSANANLHASGKKALYCIGQSPDDNTKSFGLFAMSH